ncbi:hypothetical protein [Scytonema hofmannii]|uniref:hypothetical protein n=1 Tax=Scytonema hofmannii TaxID=34078 RepID=UPI00034BA8E5|nr:hypothetical protein [Scytonema hofmannii]
MKAVFGKRESIGNSTRFRTDKDWEMLKLELDNFFKNDDEWVNDCCTRTNFNEDNV